MLILLPGHQFNLVVQGQGHKLGQGHLKIKVISRSNCKFLTLYRQAGGGSSTERHSCYIKSYCHNHLRKSPLLDDLTMRESGHQSSDITSSTTADLVFTGHKRLGKLRVYIPSIYKVMIGYYRK